MENTQLPLYLGTWKYTEANYNCRRGAKSFMQSAILETTIEETLSRPPKLTVVIIGRNEEQFIAKSIGSALAAESLLAGVEVIFVDSASTDRSVEIASEFPIRILQLRREWPLCVAAGRYTGYRYSHGEYILFLDGDAEIEKDWLAEAIAFMDEHPQYGAIAGVLDEEYVTPEDVRVGGRTNVFHQDLSKPFVEGKTLGGIALYRRAALEKAGTVNPHLPTAEDHELCLRLRNAGFKLVKIPSRMAVKYTEKRDTFHEILRRSRTKMYDYGAVIRYSSEYGGGAQYVLDTIPYILSFSLTFVLFAISIPVAIYFGALWIVVLSAIGLFGAIVIKKRGVRRAMLSVAVRSISTYRTIVSYLKTSPKPIADYPTDVIEVR